MTLYPSQYKFVDINIGFLIISTSKKEKRPPLRQYLMDGDFFIGAALGTTLTKLALRHGNQVTKSKQNRFDADVMLIMSSMIHLGKSGTYTIYLSVFVDNCFYLTQMKCFCC